MKYFFSLFFFLFFSLSVFSQAPETTIPGSFQLIKNNFPDQSVFFTKSILKSNLETYRLKNKRVVLEFKNGFQCELLSAKEVFMSGVKVDMNTYQENFDKDFALPIFSINEHGWLMAEYKTTGKSY
jgi:hypothetical protein